jgi:hypothetical protein
MRIQNTVINGIRRKDTSKICMGVEYQEKNIKNFCLNNTVFGGSGRGWWLRPFLSVLML